MPKLTARKAVSEGTGHQFLPCENSHSVSPQHGEDLKTDLTSAGANTTLPKYMELALH